MQHFRGKCNTFAAPFAPSAAAPKDRPSAIEMMNRRPPQKLSITGKVRASQSAPASQHAHMNASPRVTNFHMNQPTTTLRPARNPISCGGAGSSLSSLLASVPTQNLDCTRFGRLSQLPGKLGNPITGRNSGP